MPAAACHRPHYARDPWIRQEKLHNAGVTSPSRTLLVERLPGGVVTLTLNNPERRNALDAPLATELLAATEGLHGDHTARCVVLTGAGSAFCSGADLGALRAAESRGTLARRDRLTEYYGVFLGIRRLPMPVIGAINGAAVGAGLNLALCCDVRIAASSARFGATFVRLGIHPGGGVTHMLTRLVGPAAAAEMLLAGELVDAGRALAMGLVNRVVDDAEVIAAAASLATTIAANSPQAVRATKRTLALALDSTFATSLELESVAQAATQESDDAAEGWAAFKERRDPQFDD